MAKFRRGTRVKITKDVRPNAPATGKLGIYTGDADKGGWLLFTADGKPETESYVLPEGYNEWNPETQDWPGIPCGIRSDNPLFKLDDGTTVTGAQCYWEPVNPKIQKRIEEEYERVMQKIGRIPN